MITHYQLDRWIKAAGSGDSDAMTRLYEAAGPAVYAYALSILNHPQDAEDVLQECFITIARAGSQYCSQGKPMAWIITVAKNLCYKLQRKNARYLPLTYQEYFPGTLIDPDDKLLVESCMKQLTQQEQQIVILHAVAGCKHREIAGILGLNPSTVLSKYHRAIRKLRSFL